MVAKLYNLINDENGMPRLNVVKEVEYEVGPEFLRPYDTIDLLCKLTNMQNLHAENVYMATYDHYNELIGFFHIGTGGINQVQISARIKATCVLLSGGYSFELFHNHPSGDNGISENDEVSTYMEKALSAYIEAEYIADYIVTKNGWTCVNTGEEYNFTDEELKFINS